MNNFKLKWKVMRYSFEIALTESAAAVLISFLFAIAGLDWKVMIPIVGVMLTSGFVIQKQKLDEAKFINQIFTDFNRKYGELNDDLDRITHEIESKKLTGHERKILSEYFNLCSEEYVQYREGFVYPEVWQSWKAGMQMWLANERIESYWKEEIKAFEKTGANDDGHYNLALEFGSNKVRKLKS